ncbi:MAG: hypothetical protein D6784_09000 [Chloroflexi bacterium]|nr:MAG: hypothetical protein D6784_09000 [Chloroflexota bacterium]
MASAELLNNFIHILQTGSPDIQAAAELARQIPLPDLLAAFSQTLSEARQQAAVMERRRLAVQEELQELKLDAAQSRQEAAARLEELENLLDGLRSITALTNPEQILQEMLSVLRRVLLFEEAAVLVPATNPPVLFVVQVATSPLLAHTRWQTGKLFQRVLDGEIVSIFNTALAAEWQNQPAELLSRAVSALHIPLLTDQQRAILICTYSKRGYFTRHHTELAQRFSPLAVQALQTAELVSALQQERDTLEARVQERTRELQAARDQAIEASRWKSQLLAKTSHELRTPLNAVVGFAEMLEAGVYGELPEKPRQILREIIANTGYLTTLVDNLLQQSQSEHSARRTYIQPVDLRSLLQRVVGLLASVAEKKGLRLAVHIPPEFPAHVLTDEEKLFRILRNLVENSIKFTPQGTVSIHTACVDGTHWRIAVRDTGIGIPDEAQTTIFEAFRQLNPSTVEKESGLGLGLSIVKDLVDLLGGQIEVHSTPGQGTEFAVLFPLMTTHSENDGHD